jgi:ABC-type amino acid transport substrate-binding protein
MLKFIAHILILLAVLLANVDMPKAATSVEQTGKQSLLALSPQEQVWLEKHPVIRVGLMREWSPISFAYHTGQPRGIDADYLNRMNRLLGGHLSSTGRADGGTSMG